MSKNHNVRTVQTYRTLTEERIRQLLNDAESAVTLDMVRQLVFEAESDDFQAFVLAMLAALNCDDIDDLDDGAIQVVQDVWNYFPHHFLDGRCPAELLGRDDL